MKSLGECSIAPTRHRNVECKEVEPRYVSSLIVDALLADLLFTQYGIIHRRNASEAEDSTALSTMMPDGGRTEEEEKNYRHSQ